MKKEDKRIIKRIKELKIIEPRPEWQTLSRAVLLSKIKPVALVQPTKLSWQEYGWFFVQLFRQRLLAPAVVILLVLGFSVGSSLVVNAAFYSLPGEPLYRMKIALENTQLAITPNEEKKIELKIEFAQKRVEEFDKIVAQTNVAPEVKKERINVAIRQFQKNVVAVKQHMAEAVDKDNDILPKEREKTLRIATVISFKTDELAKSLDKKAEDLSEAEKIEVKDIIAQAVESAQATSLSAQELINETKQEEAATSTQTVTGSFSQPTVDNDNNQGASGKTTATTTLNIQKNGNKEGSNDLETTPPVLNQ